MFLHFTLLLLLCQNGTYSLLSDIVVFLILLSNLTRLVVKEL